MEFNLESSQNTDPISDFTLLTLLQWWNDRWSNKKKTFITENHYQVLNLLTVRKPLPSLDRAVNTTTHKKPSVDIEPCKQYSLHAVFYLSSTLCIFKFLKSVQTFNNVALKCIEDEDFVAMPIDLVVIQSRYCDCG